MGSCVSSSVGSNTGVPMHQQDVAGRNRGNSVLLQTSGVSLPVQRFPNYKPEKPIIKEELEKLREDFWGSRVDGNREIWGTIRTCAEMILQSSNGNDEIETANAILTASNIKTPRGTLELCYDEWGFAYHIPNYCLSDPIAFGGSQPKSISAPVSRSELGSQVSLEVRVYPSDKKLLIKCHSNTFISELKELIQQQSIEANKADSQTPICEVAKQRVIYLGREFVVSGQMLKDTCLMDTTNDTPTKKTPPVKVLQVFLRPDQKNI